MSETNMATKRAKILVVEADSEARTALTRLLEQSGYEVAGLETIEEAVHRIEGQADSGAREVPAGTDGAAGALVDRICIPPNTTIEQLERVAITEALQRFGGNRTHTARSLGISVRTLQRKLQAWGTEKTAGVDGGSLANP